MKLERWGKKMGTTSPQVGLYDISQEDIKHRLEFFRDNLEKVRKMGERMGTTSPQVGLQRRKELPHSISTISA